MAKASNPPVDVQTDSGSTVRGILCLCVGLCLFSVQDVIIKHLSLSLPVHQIVFMRGLVALPLMFVYVHFDSGFATFKTNRPWLHALRAVTMFGSYIAYYLALPVMPLTTAVALFFTAPLFITALAVPMLGESVGWRRWMGLAAGFVGMLVILRPGFADIEPAALLAIVAALTYALAQLMGRKLGATDSASVMSFYMGFVFVYMGGMLGLAFGSGEFADGSNPSWDALLGAWSPPALTEIALIVTIGVTSAIGFVLLTQAYRIGEANKVAPFEYTMMIWATLFGFIFFGTVPDGYTLLGAGLIAASGIYVLHRERKTKVKPRTRRKPFRSRYAMD